MTKYTTKETLFQHKLRKTILILTYLLVLLILVFITAMLLNTWVAKPEKSVESDTNIDVTQQLVTPESEDVLKTAEPQPTATQYVVPKMIYSSPEDLGFDTVKLDNLDIFIQEQINNGFPGAVLLIAKNGQIVFHKAYGYSKKYEGWNLLSQFEDMQLDTMFDLASLTKIYTTTFSLMKLVDEGKVSLDGKVAQYLTGYTGDNKSEVTIEMLLSHSAGYTENYYFYKTDSQYKTLDRSTVFNYATQIPLDEEPGSVYSYNNLNYILLGMIVEQVSGMRIDEYAKMNIYKPLGIETEVTYRPLAAGIEKSDIAATERLGNTRDELIYFPGIREYTLQGEVHDENTYYCMDEVSGHAGLFASSYGLTVLNQLLLNGGEYEGIRIYSEETVDSWLKTINDKKYQLGFWNAKVASGKLAAYVSDSTFYHNGWTGTATILDTENDLSVILLTNKRHSPCPDGDFEGLDYSIAYYVSVIEKVYQALIR